MHLVSHFLALALLLALLGIARTVAFAPRSLLSASGHGFQRTMSSYTLAQAISPSRKSVPPRKAAKGRKVMGDVELPDYVAPEPKTPMERREWDRMSSRMEGEWRCFRSYARSAY